MTGSTIFASEENLKDLVLSLLKDDEKSISMVVRELEGNGIKLHRLMVTGYLRALRDVGILREKELPPSKLYSTSTYIDKNIYEIVGEKCRAVTRGAKKAQLACFVMQRLLHRPVFLEELKQCGFDSVNAKLVGPEETGEERKRLVKSGFKIPLKDPAYMVEDDMTIDMMAVFAGVIIEKYGVKKLVSESKQVTLADL